MFYLASNSSSRIIVKQICLEFFSNPLDIVEPKCIIKDPSPSKQIALDLVCSETPKETLRVPHSSHHIKIINKFIFFDFW